MDAFSLARNNSLGGIKLGLFQFRVSNGQESSNPRALSTNQMIAKLKRAQCDNKNQIDQVPCDPGTGQTTGTHDATGLLVCRSGY
jgi:hypothetical protein